MVDLDLIRFDAVIDAYLETALMNSGAADWALDEHGVGRIGETQLGSGINDPSARPQFETWVHERWGTPDVRCASCCRAAAGASTNTGAAAEIRITSRIRDRLNST